MARGRRGVDLVDARLEHAALGDVGDVDAEPVAQRVDDRCGVLEADFLAPSARSMVRLRPAKFMRAWSVTRATVRLVTKCDDGWVDTYQLPTCRSMPGRVRVVNS